MTEKKHIPGKPMYSVGDRVSFELKFIDGNIETFDGVVEIVDKYGTWEDPSEPSYDIMVSDWYGSGEPMFCKHINESSIKALLCE